MLQDSRGRASFGVFRYHADSQRHTLVIPKKEVDFIFDMEAEEHKRLWAFAQEVAKKEKAAIPCVKVGVAVVGLEVPHTHIHLVPINEIKDLNFTNEKLKFTEEEFREIQKAITGQ